MRDARGRGRKRSRPSGFTLVELVIVIAVIGILAAVAIPRFIDIRTEAYTAQRDGIISSVRTGVLLVASKNQVSATPAPSTFPPNLEATWGGVTGGTQPGAFPSGCDADNCFELVLSGPIATSGWSQETATSYTFTPNAGSPTTYTYDSAKGTLQ